MVEERRSVTGYEEQYDVTRSGRIIIKKITKFVIKKEMNMGISMFIYIRRVLGNSVKHLMYGERRSMMRT